MEEERTNGETLLWVQSFKGYGQVTFNSAKSFLHFDGDHRQLKSWKERFLMEQKKIKQDIHKAHARVRWYRYTFFKSTNQLCA